MKVIKWYLLFFIVIICHAMEYDKVKAEEKNILSLLKKNDEEIMAVTFLSDHELIACIKHNGKFYTRILNLLKKSTCDISSILVECDEVAIGYNNIVIILSEDFLHLSDVKADAKETTDTTLKNTYDYPRINVLFPEYIPTKIYTHSKKSLCALLSADSDKYKIEIFQVNCIEGKFNLERIFAFREQSKYKDHTLYNNAFIFKDDDFLMVQMNKQGQLSLLYGHLIEVSVNKELKKTYQIESKPIHYSKTPVALALDYSGRFLAAYSNDGQLELIDLEKTKQKKNKKKETKEKEGRCVWKVKVGTNNIEAKDVWGHMFFSNDGNYLVMQVGSQKETNDNQQLLIFNALTGEKYKELFFPNSAAAVQFSPSNQCLLVDDIKDNHRLLLHKPYDLFLKDMCKKNPLIKLLQQRELTGKMHY